MSNVIRVLLMLFLLPLALAAQDDGMVVKTFGEPGEKGSFRVGFRRAGGDVQWLQLLDHYRSVKARDHAERDPGDYLLLIDHPVHTLALKQVGTVFAKDPASAEWQYEEIDGGVRFTLADEAGLVLEKVLRHVPERRGFTVELTLRNESSEQRGLLPLQLGGPALVNASQSTLFGDVSLSLAAPVEDGDIESVKASPEGAVQQFAVQPSVLQFAGSTNRFFAGFVWPLDEPTRGALKQLEVDTLLPRPNTDDNLTTRVRYGLDLQVPAQGQATTVALGLYLGPKSYRVFDTLPEGDRERFAPVLELDLNPPCCGGITIPGGKPMAKLLIWLLGVFYDLVGNWGVAIILLTFLVRGAMSPLNFRMQKSMRAYGQKMAKLKPQLDALKKQHGDDQRAYQQAMIQFQRENKIMPPLGGCLPMFLTMPIYLGLFTALRTAYDVRHEPFVLWIKDLSSSDALVELGFWPGEINLLPLLWVGLYLFLVLRQPLPNDPQQRQMQKMMRFMPMIFAVMLYTYASALLLYMVTSMVWSLIESSIVRKILGPMDPSAAGMAPQMM